MIVLKYVCSFAAQMFKRRENRVHICTEKAYSSTCYITAYFFLAIFVHFAAQAGFSTTVTSTGQILGFQAKHNSAPFYQPINNETQSGHVFVTEFLKETEGQEKPHFSKVFDFHASQSVIKNATSGALEKFRPEFLRSLQNRPSLSLIILHHSWKSFLS
ncbi:MAG: hypothetical protein WAZ98_09230 [Cyclobacteriaceae bacterium]